MCLVVFVKGNIVLDSGFVEFNTDDMFPLVKTKFMGEDTYVPFNTEKILISHYKDISIPKDKINYLQE